MTNEAASLFLVYCHMDILFWEVSQVLCQFFYWIICFFLLCEFFIYSGQYSLSNICIRNFFSNIVVCFFLHNVSFAEQKFLL